jgi:hypothetical protein
LNNQDDARLISEAQSEFARYLSDEIAPMIFADSAEILFKLPPEVMVRGIHSWVGVQLQGPRPSPVSDYLLHSARKVHNLGELELIPAEELNEFLGKLGPLLVSICPEQDRRALTTNLGLLEVSDRGGMAAHISVGPSPHRGGTSPPSGPLPTTQNRQTDQQPPTQQLQQPPEAPPPTESCGSSASGGEPTPTGDQTGAHIDRLNQLLDRWERLSPAAGPDKTSALDASLVGAQGAILSRIIDEVASSARSTTDLDNQLRYLDGVGVDGAGTGVFRVLSGTLPDWAPARPPTAEDGDPRPLFGAAETMKKVVELAKDPAELNERFRELITAALEEFNGGSIGRAVTVLDLAQRMVSEKEVDPSFAANIIDQTTGNLDRAQLKRYADQEDKRILLRRVLVFFPSYQVDNLIQDLMVEERRDRRRLLLQLLMIHGEDARVATIKVLGNALTGETPQPWFVQRNLIYLLRSLPSEDKSSQEKEIDLLVRASVPGGEIPLIREALTGLSQIDNPRAAQTLIARVSDFEDLAAEKGQAIHGASEIESLLDTAVNAVVRFDTKEAHQCVVTHGLSRRPELGDTFARLAMLSAKDLSEDRAAINRITGAIEAELPVKVFGVPVKTPRRAYNIARMLESLSGTDSPGVRKVFDNIIRNYPGQQFADEAAKALTKLDGLTASRGDSGDAEPATSLSGDLALFGLPNLLQNLADSGVEGVLTVIDDHGSSTASITLCDGAMVEAAGGGLENDAAVYQLLERPTPGRFIFVNQTVDVPGGSGSPSGTTMINLLMEGMRRYDELNRAAAVIPEEASFGATGQQPTGLADETDANFVNDVWLRAAKGATPIEIENSSGADAYRVFRLFEHWVNEGSLEQKS